MVSCAANLRKLAVCGFTIILSACTTFTAFPGPERKDSEIAIVETSVRYYGFFLYIDSIMAVDGVRAGPHQYARMLPGSHWLELKHSAGVVGPGGGGEVEGFACVLQGNFEAGHRYQIKAHSFKPATAEREDSSRAVYSGSVAVDVSAGETGGRTVIFQVACAAPGSTFCKEASHCNQFFGPMTCSPQPGYDVGTCEKITDR